MKKEMIARAWTDPEYRASLSAEQRAELPESPVGAYEIDPTMLELVVGGGGGGGKKKINSEGWFCTASAECWGFPCGLLTVTV